LRVFSRLETTIAGRQAVSPLRPDDTPGRGNTASNTPHHRGGGRSPADLPAWWSPRRLAIFGAVPEGSRRARSQVAWRRAVQEHPDAAVLRTDAYDNLSAVVWLLMRHADWSTMTTRPTWAVLMERTRLSKSSVAKWLAWLRERGLLGTVVSGSTVRYRKGTACGSINDGLGNIAAEYVLAIPTTLDPAPNDAPSAAQPAPATPAEPVEVVGQPAALALVDITRTPSEFPSGGGELSPRRRAREATGPVDHGLAAATRAAKQHSKIIKDRALVVAEDVRARSLDLRRLSAKHVRHLITEFVLAGWTAADVVHAIDHTPDGQPRPFAGSAKHPAGWFRHRLAAWRDADSTPIPSRSQHLAAAAARRDIERQALTDQRATLRAARVDADAGPAARARALLAATQARLAAKTARTDVNAAPADAERAMLAAAVERQALTRTEASRQDPPPPSAERGVRRGQLYVVKEPAPDTTTTSAPAGMAGRQERAAAASEPESAFYASLGVEARAMVDGALSEREIAAQRRWLARTQNARTIAADLSAPRPAVERGNGDPDADRERAWLVQMMAARTPQEETR
ncbi:hypothetical protein ACFXJ8_39125, partial [Nonomuraea sp. NPDC059194]|uniref:hypothetical protein n=1 Tax=Nonomuraea sp. NPDC059194 TaxID=3346764 RepID=UPI0036C753A8